MLLRWLAITMATIVFPVAGYGVHGRRGGGLGVALALLFLLVGFLMAPRRGHQTLRRGQAGAALRWFRLSLWFSTSRLRVQRTMLSIAAAQLRAGKLDDAARSLGRLDRGTLLGDERAAWCNNRAWLELARGGSADQASALATEALALRPDVAAFHHTSARALIQLGRHDDAMRLLDGIWSDDPEDLDLEVTRCRDLADVWDARGHATYAADYRERAARLLRAA